MIKEGEAVYKVYTTDSAKMILDRLSLGVIEGMRRGEKLGDSLDIGLKEILGLDLYSPSDKAKPGDRVSTVAGVEVIGEERIENDRETLHDVVTDILGIKKDDLENWREDKKLSIEQALEKNLDKALVRPLSRVLTDLPGDMYEAGCLSVMEGIEALQEYQTERESLDRLIEKLVRDLIKRITGAPPEDDGVLWMLRSVIETLGTEHDF